MSQYPFRRLQANLAELIGSLPAESRLPSEPELARRMGVSRATLREAMRSFEGQGMIRRRQGVGTFVIGKVPVLDSGLEVLESIETIGGGAVGSPARTDSASERSGAGAGNIRSADGAHPASATRDTR